MDRKTMSRAKYIILFIALTAALASCARGPAVFGDPDSAKFQKMSVAAIKRTLLEIIDKPVSITGTFVRTMGPGLVEERESFLIKTEYGEVLIAYPEAKYQKTAAGLHKGQDILVYGNVSVAKLPGRDKTILTIKVN